MRTEKELMELIKSSYSLEPREDFIQETEKKLRLKARKSRSKKAVGFLTVAVSVFILGCFALTSFNQQTKEPAIQLSTNTNQYQPSTILTDDPLVYISQTHNYESFLPELTAIYPEETFNVNDSIHETINMTLVGQRLSSALKQRNINNILDTNDNTKQLQEKELPYQDAYKISRINMQDALMKNQSIQMAFDLHRDSARREVTTLEIDGKAYAKITIVVSEGDAGNYEKNQEFARQLHKKINDKYPGISRGVFSKSYDTYQNHYNQDLLNQSAVIEIGGFENTLEEEYNTVEALANVIQTLVK
ncbi:stage II sporulation protein P [Niallia taxi]|uniref:stage II sporulation protein P n=1 Tax=Niallia taxi TaxID=2499688 RepID=UPI00300BEA56